jgi:hypothetical protein
MGIEQMLEFCIENCICGLVGRKTGMIQFCLRSLKRVCSLLPEKKALQWQPRGMTERIAQA